MSKLFSPLSLLDEHVSIVNIESTDSYVDESFFIETLNFITEQNKAFSRLNANLYKNINESSNDPIVIRESFSEFFSGVKKFIKSVIKFLKNLIAKFWVRINSLFMRDKYIEEHKNELAKFASQHEFDVQGYNYKFEEDVPAIGVLQKLEQSIADFKTEGGKGKDPKGLKSAYDAFLDKKGSNSYLDDIRKECIKAKSNIDESDFKDELFKVFRSGDSSTSKITVTNAIVVEALTFFTNYDKMKTSTQRYSDNVEKAYNAIQKGLDRADRLVSSEDDVVSVEDIVDNDKSGDKLALYDLFFKAKSQEITVISNMHLMAFSAKLDALKECYTQDKQILYGAFKKLLAKSESYDDDHSYTHHSQDHHDNSDYYLRNDPKDSDSVKQRKENIRKHLLRSIIRNEDKDISNIPEYSLEEVI